MALHLLPTHEPTLCQGGVLLTCDDKVIVYGDAHELSRLYQLPRDADVFPARFGIAGRVVVEANDRRGVV